MNIEPILRNTLIGGVFLILLAPFIVANEMFFPFITGKNFFFRIVVELLFGGWIVLAYLNPAYRLRKDFLLIAFAAFVAIIALADVFGVDPSKSFWSNFERMEGLVGLLHVFAYVIVASAVLTTEKLWKRFFQAALGLSVIMGVIAMGQMAGVIDVGQSSNRVDGRLGNATYLAVYALFHVFFAVLLFVRERKDAVMLRTAYVAAGAVNLIALYGTATRGAVVGLLGSIVLMALILAVFGKGHPKLRRGAAGALVALVLLVGGFIAVKDAPFIQESPVLSRFAKISFEEKTTRSRFMIWGMAWEGFKERPVLGWGQGNFMHVFSKHYNPRMYDQEPWFDRAHNVFFDWLIAGGVPGLLAYLALFAAALALLVRNRRFSLGEKTILIGLLGAYFLQNLFVFDNLISYILFTSLLAYIIASSRKDYDEKIIPSRSLRSAEIAMPMVIGVITLASVYMINYKPMRANAALLDALRGMSSGNVEQGISYFKQAFAYNTFGDTEAREQLGRYAQNVASSGKANTQARKELVTLALQQQAEQIEESPTDVRQLLFYASTLRAAGQYDKALEMFERARELSPTRPHILLQMGEVYVAQKKYQEAFEIFKEGYELEPEFETAQKLYAIAAVYVGKDELAGRLMGKEELLSDLQFATPYAIRGEHQKVLLIWQTVVKERPQNPQYRTSLAAAYLNVGRREEAIAQLEKAAELNERFRDQAEYYIREIRAGRNP